VSRPRPTSAAIQIGMPVKGRCPRSGVGIGSGFRFLPRATWVVCVGVGGMNVAEVVVCVPVCDSSEVVVGPCAGAAAVEVDDGDDDEPPAVEVDVDVDVDVTVVVPVDVDPVVEVLDEGEVIVVVVVGVVLSDVVDEAVLAVVVVAEQSRKFPLSLPFEPLPWLSSQFPCPPPLCTHGSPPYPGGHSGAVSVSPRRSLPAFVLVDCVAGVAGRATAIAVSVPAVKIAAARATDRSAFFMAGD